MAESELDKLKKLSPQERLKKLKEMSKKRQNEMSQIETLIKTSEKEAQIESETTDDEPLEIPKKASIDSVVSEEQERRQESFAPSMEGSYETFKQAQADYTSLQQIAYAGMSGQLNENHLEAIDHIGERLEKIKYHSASSEVANLAVASRSVLYKIKRYAGLE